MLRRGGANMTGSQTVRPQPFVFNAGTPAILFDLGLVSRLKNSLPAQPHASAKISHVHTLLFDKAFSDFRMNPVIHFPGINQGCFSTLPRRPLTKEVDLQRPRMRIGILIVGKDALFRWVVGRSVNMTAYLPPWRRTLAVFQQLSRHQANELFKVRSRTDIKAAE